MSQIKDLLTVCKANSQTFYNLRADQIEYFQKKYRYLKKHGHKKVRPLYEMLFSSVTNKTEFKSYTTKIALMRILEPSI